MTSAAPLTLMALWKRHKPECRSISAILADARQGNLPGAVETDRGSIIITNESAALAAMTEDNGHGPNSNFGKGGNHE